MQFPLRAKMRRTQREQIKSAIPHNPDPSSHVLWAKIGRTQSQWLVSPADVVLELINQEFLITDCAFDKIAD